MHKKLLPFIVCSLLLAGCGGGRQGQNGHKAKGGVYYGGVFRRNEVVGFRSLYPDNLTDITAYNIGNQIYERLNYSTCPCHQMDS